MAAEIVNLRTMRKRKKRAEDDAAAAQNRISHGRTKAERRRTDAENTLEARRHEAGRLDTDDKR
ncbi:DUF4169 family protein [Pararhizobium haloflavum]|uniref:DUF4169 family protein n=1 Tax=Pararhizobium haloflavum TaxID=2037914 RepID=UPI000C17A22E|nr:DUF4169 family protein [Pararhizobium haloflavum]